MSSESNTTERLIDLMYGEASDESREEFLEEIAGSPDLQRDQAEIRALLGDVSELWSEQPVTASVHQSIMDAAQSATLERAEKRQYVAPIKPPGLWSRLRSSSQFGQFAMVATVLIAGAFVFKFVNLEESKVVDEASVFSPTFGTKTLKKGAPIAIADKKSEEGMDAIAPKSQLAKNLPVENEKANAPLLRKEQHVGQTGVKNEEKARELISKRGTRLKKKKTIAKPEKSKRSTRQTTKSAIPTGSAKNKAFFDTLADEKDLKASGGSVAERVQNAEELKLVPSKTIDSVSTKYGARDYAATIQAADEFVGLKSGTRSERARALQLKAQSLANLGRYQEAIRVYDSILKNYKTYQSSSISSARAEISRKLEERRPAKKSRKKAKKKSKESTYDFEEATTY